MFMAYLFNQAHHARNTASHVVRHPKRKRKIEHDFRISRASDLRVKLRRDREHQVTFDYMEASNSPVVHEQPVFVLKWMTVGPLDGRAGRGPDMRQKQWRLDLRCERLQIAVIPCRLDVLVEAGNVTLAVPADTKAVPVRRRLAPLGVKALVDQRMLCLENDLIQIDWSTRVCKPTAHSNLLSRQRGYRLSTSISDHRRNPQNS